VSEVEGGVSTCFGEVGGVGAGGVVEEASVTAISTRKPQAGGPMKRKPEGGRTEAGQESRVKSQESRQPEAGTYTHICSIGIRAHHIYVLLS
jgi:hypothetical protein